MDEGEATPGEAVRPRTVAVIPARLESQRLPRKLLLDVHGLPVVVHTYRRCLLAESLDDVVIATDSDEIREVADAHGCRVVMTSSVPENGTERMAEAASQIEGEILVSVFGDEALVAPRSIDLVVGALHEDPTLNVAILVNPFTRRGSPSDIKVVLDREGYVRYLSRSDIPSDARSPGAPMLKAYHVLPFRKDFLLDYASWEPGQLEQVEMVEHLRILERGHRMKAVHVESSAVSIDTPEDLEYVRSQMLDDPLFPLYRDG